MTSISRAFVCLEFYYLLYCIHDEFLGSNFENDIWDFLLMFEFLVNTLLINLLNADIYEDHEEEIEAVFSSHAPWYLTLSRFWTDPLLCVWDKNKHPLWKLK